MRTQGMPAPRTSRALLALVAAAALLVLGAGPALAHDEVVATTPAADASLPSPPSTVELQVGSPPQVLGTEVRVTGPDGAVVSVGDPEVLGTTVRQPLADGLPAGAYTVDYRVTSGDGHPVTGSFGFTTAEGATPSTAPSSASTQAPAPASEVPPADPSSGVDTDEASSARPAGSSSTGLLVAGGVVALAVVGLVAWRLRRSA
jgi:methionine-rich copper-binding protein CopC